MNEDSTPAGGEQDIQQEFTAFSQVVSAMQLLRPDSRLKLFRTLATFFNVPLFDQPFPRSAPTTSVRSPSPGLSGSSSAASESSFSEDRTISAKEFLLQKKPMQDIERVACLGYYLTHYRDTPHFKTLDISKLNTEAAQIKLSNAAAAVNNATDAGLLVQATKGAKQISAMGELYVQALPDRQAARDAMSHFRRKRRTKKSGTSANGGPSSDNGGESE